MIKHKNINEQGFSLLELSISIAIMAIAMTVGLIYTAGDAILTAQKTAMKNDLTAVAIELSGWDLNNTVSPSPQEFSQIKNRVLSDYLNVATADELTANEAYLNGMEYVKVNGFYCVSGSRVLSTQTLTMNYNSATNKVTDGACPLV